MDYDYTSRKRGVMLPKVDPSQSKADLATQTGVSIDKINDEITHWFIETNSDINYAYSPSNLSTIPYRADIPTVAKVREHYKISDNVLIEYDRSSKVYTVHQSAKISEVLKPQISKTKQYYFVPHKSSYGNIETVKRDLKITDTRVIGEKYGAEFWKLTIPKGLHVPDTGVPMIPAFVDKDEMLTTYNLTTTQVVENGEYALKSAPTGATETITLPRIVPYTLSNKDLLDYVWAEFLQLLNHNTAFRNYFKTLNAPHNRVEFYPAGSEDSWNNRQHEAILAQLEPATTLYHGFSRMHVWLYGQKIGVWQNFSHKFNSDVGFYIAEPLLNQIKTWINNNQPITLQAPYVNLYNKRNKGEFRFTYVMRNSVAGSEGANTALGFGCSEYTKHYVYKTVDKKMIWQKITTASDKQRTEKKSDTARDQNNALMILKAYGYLIGRFNNDPAFRTKLKAHLQHYDTVGGGYLLQPGSILSPQIVVSGFAGSVVQWGKVAHDITKSPTSLKINDIPVNSLAIWFRHEFGSLIIGVDAIISDWANPIGKIHSHYERTAVDASVHKPVNDKLHSYGHQVFNDYKGGCFWTFSNHFHETNQQAQVRFASLNIKPTAGFGLPATDLSAPWLISDDTAHGYSINYAQVLENTDYIAKLFGVDKTDITTNTDGSCTIRLQPTDETNDSMRQRAKPTLDNLPTPANSWIELNELKL